GVYLIDVRSYFRLLHLPAHGFAEHGNAGQACSQVVVDISRNSSPLPFQTALAFELLDFAAVAPPSKGQYSCPNSSRPSHNRDRLKPDRLPEERLDDECE